MQQGVPMKSVFQGKKEKGKNVVSVTLPLTTQDPESRSAALIAAELLFKRGQGA